MTCDQLAVSKAAFLSTLTAQQFCTVMEQMQKNHPHPWNWVGTPNTYYNTTQVRAQLHNSKSGRATTFAWESTTYPNEPDPTRRTETNVQITHELMRRNGKPSAEQEAFEAEFEQLSKIQTILAMIANLKQAGAITAMNQVAGATVITLNVED